MSFRSPPMRDRTAGRRTLVVLWILVLAALPIWMSFDRPGWDVAIYHSAIVALKAGHDPYADAIAVQNRFHAQKANSTALLPATNTDPPYSYVYSPVTLPLLRLAGSLPAWLSGAFYWSLYGIAVLVQLWVGLWATNDGERPKFLYLAPLAAFFPGLLANGIVLSGNVAYLLYAAVLLAAVFAWKGGSWRWFYLLVLAASCVKAPLLSLVVIPVLSARRQWVPATATTAASCVVFALQPLLWPTLFRHYLQAVELQFSFNRDFGCSPAGLFSGVLYDRTIPYKNPALVLYACYAIPLFALLVFLSRRFQQGAFSLKQWVPVLLVGTVLLNPRLIEYDVAPLTLPLALITWRSLRSVGANARIVPGLILVFLTINAFALSSWDLRKLMDGPLLVFIFLAGSWSLLRATQKLPVQASDIGQCRQSAPPTTAVLTYDRPRGC